MHCLMFLIREVKLSWIFFIRLYALQMLRLLSLIADLNVTKCKCIGVWLQHLLKKCIMTPSPYTGIVLRSCLKTCENLLWLIEYNWYPILIWKYDFEIECNISSIYNTSNLEVNLSQRELQSLLNMFDWCLFREASCDKLTNGDFEIIYSLVSNASSTYWKLDLMLEKISTFNVRHKLTYITKRKKKREKTSSFHLRHNCLVL